jgi:DNA-nicking Smr family endonuclease
VKRPLRPDELKAWASVARTVTPAPGRAVPELPEEPKPPAPPPATGAPLIVAPADAKRLKARPAPKWEPDPIEPKRRRRIVKERQPIEARVDLHGLTLFEAEARVKSFVRRSWEQGFRAILIVTGKGSSGAGGIIRDWAPTWLADASLAGMVAGVAQAERRHGGEGALYVALKARRGD